ncbi:MAG: aa3-type cytochrome oxidase subunit II [Nocardioidaceae bacterium]
MRQAPGGGPDLAVDDRRTDDDRCPTGWRRALSTGVILAVAIGLLSGCSMRSDNSLMRLALPKAISDRSKPMFDLWVGSWIAAGIIGVFVWGLIIWAVLHYRRRSDDDIPAQVRYNLPIEVLYTLAPLIVVGVLFVQTAQAQQAILSVDPNPDHQVDVVAQQWAWSFNYVDEPSVGGTVYDVGNPENFAELWLPVDQSVTFTLRSADVAHSFWVPEFYFKMDVIPGRENQFSMTPTVLGTFRGRCAELCGTYHSRMLFDVHVVTQAQFEAHLSALKAAGQTGELTGSNYTYQVAGLEPQGQNGAGQ